MKKTWKVVLLFELFVLLGTLLGAHAQSSGDKGKGLGDLARGLRAEKQAQNPCPTAAPCEGFPSRNQTYPNAADDSEPRYRAEIQGLVARQAFAELDEAAESVRSSKDRLGGGVWKLYVFYQVVSAPGGDTKAPPSNWPGHLALLRNWVAASPMSSTAHVALAECYRNWAWLARGGSYADQVTEYGWKQFNAREVMARNALIDAGKLSPRCPHWYFAMLELAVDQGWDKQQAREIFESAVAFEPSYYHYYREYAYDLLPRWSGEPGEAESFAEESLRRIGGKQGAFVYFEIATVLYCMCNDAPDRPTLSWPKIQEGFAEMEENYGATTLKLNRYAMLAYLYQDWEVARNLFARVGTNWDHSVWTTRPRFDRARTWARAENP